jgi:ribosomal protein S18 acetylase RimI-like enzyme
MTVRIVPAAYSHVNRLARDMRAIDRAECLAMGRTPKQALRHGIMASAWVRTALVDGEPQAMFGVVVESAMTGDGIPWFLGTDAVFRHGRDLIRMGPAILRDMGDSSRMLRNLVSADNAKAIRLLKRWGFTVDPEHVRVGGLPFRRFEMEFG